MAPSATPLVMSNDGERYALNKEQILIASRALINHMGEKTPASAPSKENLLAPNEEDSALPIYLTLTTKKHISDQKRLKPNKIALPNPLNTSETTTILLITADPQRTYKDLVASPAFPADLQKRIVRVIDVKKLKAKFKAYEAQRKLRENCDIVLADDRIVTLLPKILGKTFYGSMKHRPIPVNLTPSAEREDGKRVKPAKRELDAPKPTAKAGSSKQIAAEITKAMGSTLVYLSPTTCTSVKVGIASWDAEKLAANINVVAMALIDKYVPKKWQGVKSIHIKGSTTMALPIWLADELWVDEADVLDEAAVEKGVQANMSKKRKKALTAEADKKTKVLSGEEGGKKRKAAEDPEETGAGVAKKEKKSKKAKVESNDAALDAEIALRREQLKKQKAEAAEAVRDDEAPKAKKSKKTAATEEEVAPKAKNSKKTAVAEEGDAPKAKKAKKSKKEVAA